MQHVEPRVAGDRTQFLGRRMAPCMNLDCLERRNASGSKLVWRSTTEQGVTQAGFGLCQVVTGAEFLGRQGLIPSIATVDTRYKLEVQ